MSNQDFKPISDTYGKRWALEGDEAFEGEVKAQKEYIFLEEIRGDFGKRYKVRDVDRVAACKRLCALATHDNPSEQKKRAQKIGSLDTFEALCNYMKTGPDALQYWSSLLTLQLLHKNIACCTVFLNCNGINTVAEMMARGDSNLARLEGDNENSYDSFFLPPCSQHTLYVCMMIASNLSHFYPESHEYIRNTQKPWSFRQQGKDKSEPPPPGILAVCQNVIRRGRTLEYPTFDAAIRLVLSLSENQPNILPLMRVDLTRAMAKHYEAETSEGPACREAARHIQNFAANLVQKYVRGHFGRNLVAHAKSHRLAKFYSNFKKKTYIRGWMRFTQDSKRIKTFFKNLFDKREKYGVKHSFKRWRKYTVWFKEIERDAHTFFTWESSRNLLFGEWIDFLRNEVAELNAKVQAKCKTVLVLITGEVFKNCIKEWRAMVQKTKVIKRRWLHGAKDMAIRKWKKFIAEIHQRFEDASDKLQFLRAHMAGDFMLLSFHEWRQVCRKKQIAARRMKNRTVYHAWSWWIEHMDEAAEVIRQVNIKCAHVVSLIAGDLFHFAFHELQKYAVLRKTLRRVTAAARQKLSSQMWRTWIFQLKTTNKIAAAIREKCAGIVFYISHGSAVKCWEIWRDTTRKKKRALRMFTHACLVHTFHAWVHEFVRQARTIKRAKARMTQYLEHFFIRLWAHNVAELHRQMETIDRIAFRMQNRSLVMCFTQWMHWTSETIYTREVVAKIRRTYEIRVVRQPLEKWYHDASHSARLKRLVYRIKNRAVKLGFEEMVRMVETSKLQLKEAMLEKSNLIARWLKRPMINCWHAWSELCAELRRRDKMLKRLRYRMLNAGAVLAISEWKTMIRLQKEERRQLLYFAVTDSLKKGGADELRATLSSHAIWNLRYDRALMEEAMQHLLAHDFKTIASKRKRILHDVSHNRGRNLLADIPPVHAQEMALISGTSVHALLLLTDHVDPAVRTYALRRLCECISTWKSPREMMCSNTQLHEMLKDMPHPDDILAVAAQRFQGDTDSSVRDAAHALVVQYSAPSTAPMNVDRSILDKRNSWRRINKPSTFLGLFHKSRDLAIKGKTEKREETRSARSLSWHDAAPAGTGAHDWKQENVQWPSKLEPLLQHTESSKPSSQAATTQSANVPDGGFQPILAENSVESEERALIEGIESRKKTFGEVESQNEADLVAMRTALLSEEQSDAFVVLHSSASLSLGSQIYSSTSHHSRFPSQGHQRSGAKMSHRRPLNGIAADHNFSQGPPRDGTVGRGEGEKQGIAGKSRNINEDNLPAHKKRQPKSKDDLCRKEEEKGREQESMLRSKSGSSHDWASDYDYTLAQMDRTRSIHHVRDTLSDFKAQLASARSSTRARKGPRTPPIPPLFLPQERSRTNLPRLALY